jgi:SOS-response transcriptional repressor LexA
MRKITPREYAIFSFIKQFLDDYEKSPTRREIGEAFSITTQGADYFVHRLIKRGVVSLRSESVRNIRPTEKSLGHQPHLW